MNDAFDVTTCEERGRDGESMNGIDEDVVFQTGATDVCMGGFIVYFPSGELCGRLVSEAEGGMSRHKNASRWERHGKRA